MLLIKFLYCRALKYKGTQKIKGCCPAEIIVEKCINGTVEVVYFSTHIGHENQLAHFRLSREDRKKLAGTHSFPFQRFHNFKGKSPCSPPS